jgi:hypothetical protein
VAISSVTFKMFGKQREYTEVHESNCNSQLVKLFVSSLVRVGIRQMFSKKLHFKHKRFLLTYKKY